MLADSQMAECKIVAKGIFGVEASELFSDLTSRLAVNALAFQKAQIPADPTGMGIEWHDEGAGVDTIPDAEVDGIGAPGYPAKIKMQSFAGTAVGGIGQEIAKATV